MYSDNIEVNSASASIEWYAFKSCANTGDHCAFNFLVLATIGKDFISTFNSGISISVSGFAAIPALVDSKSPLDVSVGCLWNLTLIAADESPFTTNVMF